MNQSTPSASGPKLRLEDLILLNREIAAMVKAGIPVELGLRGLSGGVASRLGSLAHRLGERMGNGLSLVDALEQEGPAVSPVYSAVVGAGLATGRLGEALESLTTSARLELETKRRVKWALVYPAVVAVMAFVLLTVFVSEFVPRYIRVIEDFQLPETPSLVVLKKLYETCPIWGKLIPVVTVLVVLVLGLIQRQRPTSFRIWEWIPGVGRLRRSLDLTLFVELLRLQISHGIPLATSVRRAGEATASSSLRSVSSRISDGLEQGASLAESISLEKSLPPLMRWMLVTAEKQGSLLKTLELLTDSFRRRVLEQSRWFQVWFPALVTIFLAGGMVLIYCVAFFLPLTELWWSLMQE